MDASTTKSLLWRFTTVAARISDSFEPAARIVMRSFRNVIRWTILNYVRDTKTLLRYRLQSQIFNFSIPVVIFQFFAQSGLPAPMLLTWINSISYINMTFLDHIKFFRCKNFMCKLILPKDYLCFFLPLILTIPYHSLISYLMHFLSFYYFIIYIYQGCVVIS